MKPFLAGKHAAVTGATRGIGRAIAEHLLRSGANVAICGRSQESVDRAAAELKKSTAGDVLGVAADVSNWDQVERFFASVQSRFGKLDILVNNAGVGVFRSIQEMSREDWDRTVNVNLTGAFYCCHHAIPMLRTSDSGCIVEISSLAGINAFA